jgi:hypothetical protein
LDEALAAGDVDVAILFMAVGAPPASSDGRTTGRLYSAKNFCMTDRVFLSRWDDLPLDKVTEMVARKAMGDPRQPVVQTYVKQGAIVPAHAHTGDQWIYVLEGALDVVVAGDEVTVPAGAAHQAEALEDSFVLDWRV